MAKDKPKKINVRFFLNQTVNPIKEGNGLAYPLYMVVTYNRRSTMLRSHYGNYYKDLKQVEKAHYPGFLAFEERIVKKTVQYGLKRQGDKFNIKGIGEYYQKYCLGIDLLIESNLKTALWAALARMEPQKYFFALKFEDDKVSFETLYEMALKLYPEFNKLISKLFKEELEIYSLYMRLYQASFFQYTFPTLIDWLDHSAMEDYKKKLKLVYGKKEAQIKRNIEFIDKIVRSNSKV